MSRKPIFTKGRWQLSYFEHKYWIHEDKMPGSIIARIGGMKASDRISSASHEANGYLLAHAPRMYKDIEKAIVALKGVDDKLRKDLLLTLRKARGPHA